MNKTKYKELIGAKLHICIRLGLIVFGVFCLYSCLNEKKQIANMLLEWKGKKVLFPNQCVFTIGGIDTVDFPIENGQYKILSYADSTGCMGCKLNLPAWTGFINQLDSVYGDIVKVMLFVHPKELRDFRYVLSRYDYEYPICIDMQDSINHLNHFLSDVMFQTFLLNQDNEIIAIGDPIHNPKIKELYLKIIQGKPIGEEKITVQTQVAVAETSFTFGDFPWQEAQTHSFEVKNVGHELLVIQDVTTSCGCITVDFPKEPVQPGGTATVKVTYKADQQEYFNKTVTVYGNAEQFPLFLHVSGNARQLKN